MTRAASELGRGDLPAHQQRQDHPELDDQVGRGDLERHRGMKSAPLRNIERASATAT